MSLVEQYPFAVSSRATFPCLLAEQVMISPHRLRRDRSGETTLTAELHSGGQFSSNTSAQNRWKAVHSRFNRLLKGRIGRSRLTCLVLGDEARETKSADAF